VQSFGARVRHWAARAPEDGLEAEEVVLTLLRAALTDAVEVPGPIACGPTTRRLIRRTKEVLAAAYAQRLSLGDVGRAVGASPTYLTDVFRRVEGVALHQYLTRVRLAHALSALPQADDLTTLALDLGFASHSHFSAVFRRAFGVTPSAFRGSTRRGVGPWSPELSPSP
jgi:AraC-like DNA-binding protein